MTTIFQSNAGRCVLVQRSDGNWYLVDKIDGRSLMVATSRVGLTAARDALSTALEKIEATP